MSKSTHCSSPLVDAFLKRAHCQGLGGVDLARVIIKACELDPLVREEFEKAAFYEGIGYDAMNAGGTLGGGYLGTLAGTYAGAGIGGLMGTPSGPGAIGTAGVGGAIGGFTGGAAGGIAGGDAGEAAAEYLWGPRASRGYLKSTTGLGVTPSRPDDLLNEYPEEAGKIVWAPPGHPDAPGAAPAPAAPAEAPAPAAPEPAPPPTPPVGTGAHAEMPSGEAGSSVFRKQGASLLDDFADRCRAHGISADDLAGLLVKAAEQNSQLRDELEARVKQAGWVAPVINMGRSILSKFIPSIGAQAAKTVVQKGAPEVGKRVANTTLQKVLAPAARTAAKPFVPPIPTNIPRPVIPPIPTNIPRPVIPPPPPGWTGARRMPDLRVPPVPTAPPGGGIPPGVTDPTRVTWGQRGKQIGLGALAQAPIPAYMALSDYFDWGGNKKQMKEQQDKMEGQQARMDNEQGQADQVMQLATSKDPGQIKSFVGGLKVPAQREAMTALLADPATQPLLADPNRVAQMVSYMNRATRANQNMTGAELAAVMRNHIGAPAEGGTMNQPIGQGAHVEMPSGEAGSSVFRMPQASYDGPILCGLDLYAKHASHLLYHLPRRTKKAAAMPPKPVPPVPAAPAAADLKPEAITAQPRPDPDQTTPTMDPTSRLTQGGNVRPPSSGGMGRLESPTRVAVEAGPAVHGPPVTPRPPAGADNSWSGWAGRTAQGLLSRAGLATDPAQEAQEAELAKPIPPRTAPTEELKDPAVGWKAEPGQLPPGGWGGKGKEVSPDAPGFATPTPEQRADPKYPDQRHLHPARVREAIDAQTEATAGLLKDIGYDPNNPLPAISVLSDPKKFAAYQKELQGLEQGILNQKGVDHKTIATQLDVAKRARELAASTEAFKLSGGVLPIEAIHARLQKADANDPLVRKSYENMLQNPENRPFLQQLAQRYPDQSQGIFGAISSLWDNMTPTETVMVMGGAALSIAALVNAFMGESGAGGLASAAMGGGGLLAILGGLQGGGGLMGLIQSVMGAFSGPEARTPIPAPAGMPTTGAPPAGAAGPQIQRGPAAPYPQMPPVSGGPSQPTLKPPGSATPAAPADAAAAGANPTQGGTPAAPAAKLPAGLPPELADPSKATAAQYAPHLEAAVQKGDVDASTTLAAMMFRTPDGAGDFAKLDDAINRGYSDWAIAYGSGGKLKSPQVGQLKENWPAIKAKMAGR